MNGLTVLWASKCDDFVKFTRKQLNDDLKYGMI